MKGFGGTLTGGASIGALKWRWQDDDGGYHNFIIRDSYYIPNVKMRLLSPQHWARTQKGAKDKFSETSNGFQCIMRWNNGDSKLTMDLTTDTNVANIMMAPGFGIIKRLRQGLGPWTMKIQSYVKNPYNRSHIQRNI